MSHVENDILLYICLHRRLRSEDVVDEGKDQLVKGWKTGSIERLTRDPFFVKSCHIGICILLCNDRPTPKRVCFITLIGNIQIPTQIFHGKLKGTTKKNSVLYKMVVMELKTDIK
jgi:hypothetical protein